jgi:hypothetical protein
MSKLDLSEYLGTYKCFPLILCLVWPAILALRSPTMTQARLRTVQVAVLAAALLSFEYGTVRFAAPDGPGSLIHRWMPAPETWNASLYRALEARLDGQELGDVKASQSVLALYPYSFPIWYESSAGAVRLENARKVDSLLWFEGDRDQNIIDDWLANGEFPYRYRIMGTKIRLATRRPRETLSKLGPLLGL